MTASFLFLTLCKIEWQPGVSNLQDIIQHASLFKTNIVSLWNLLVFQILQGVPIKEEFLETLKELKETIPEFEVVFEMTRDAGDKKTATDVLFEYLYEENKSLQDIFGLTEFEGELFMNRGAFIEQVMVMFKTVSF